MITIYRHNRGLVVTSPNARSYMEDRYVCYESDTIDIYAIFDGHSGSNIVDFTETNLHNELLKSLVSTTDVVDKIQSTVVNFDRYMYYLYPNDQSGTTMNMLLRYHDRWYIANVGDSRSITITQDGHVVITKDHKPDDYEEYNRIIGSGGTVVKSRVNGTLSMSRSLGDFKEGIKLRMGDYVGMPVIPLPDIYPLSTPPVKSVLATDGFWDYIGSDEVVELLIWSIENKKCIDNVIYNTFRRVINNINSRDNITVITVNM